MIMMKIVIKGSTEASEFNVNAALQITGREKGGRDMAVCTHADPSEKGEEIKF